MWQYCSCLSFAAMMTIRLRSCWRAAGQCSGSRWSPAGCASSFTCGPSSPPWSARSVLKPRSHISTQGVRPLWFFRCGLTWPRDHHDTPRNLRHNPKLLSAFSMENYLLPFVYMLVFTSLFYNVKLFIPTLMVFFVFFYYHWLLEFCIVCQFEIRWRFMGAESHCTTLRPNRFLKKFRLEKCILYFCVCFSCFYSHPGISVVYSQTTKL